jgi:plastocyanin
VAASPYSQYGSSVAGTGDATSYGAQYPGVQGSPESGSAGDASQAVLAYNTTGTAGAYPPQYAQQNSQQYGYGAGQQYYAQQGNVQSNVQPGYAQPSSGQYAQQYNPQLAVQQSAQQPQSAIQQPQSAAQQPQNAAQQSLQYAQNPSQYALNAQYQSVPRSNAQAVLQPNAQYNGNAQSTAQVQAAGNATSSARNNARYAAGNNAQYRATQYNGASAGGYAAQYGGVQNAQYGAYGLQGSGTQAGAQAYGLPYPSYSYTSPATVNGYRTSIAAPATAPGLAYDTAQGSAIGTSGRVAGAAAPVAATAAMPSAVNGVQGVAGRSVTVAIRGYAYQPQSLVVRVGTRVVWVNDDAVAHTVTSSIGAFNSGSIAPGQSVSYTFTVPGTYQYMCTIHPGMRGTITVIA